MSDPFWTRSHPTSSLGPYPLEAHGPPDSDRWDAGRPVLAIIREGERGCLLQVYPAAFGKPGADFKAYMCSDVESAKNKFRQLQRTVSE